MNSRNSRNEKNIVKFSTEVSLNQREAKNRIEIPFDHIYACHSRTAEIQRPNLQLAKEVEITTQCAPHEHRSLLANPCDVSTLRDRVAGYERKVKKLKNLLIHHIDLAQLQSEYASKREKHFQAIKQENNTLRTRIKELEKGISNLQSDLRETRQSNRLNRAPPNATITQPAHRQNTELMLNNAFTELLIPGNRNSFVFDNNLNSTSAYTQNQQTAIKQEPETDRESPELVVTSILDNSVKFPFFDILGGTASSTMDKTEKRTGTVYTKTGNSNSSLLRTQKGNRKNAVGTNMGRSKYEQKEAKQYEASRSLERKFTVNKKSKMINTYGKSSNSTVMKPSQYTGSLTDRLQLIDTTPTGEDPYQLRESDLREQSPIPKLMLQKTNHGRIKICSCDNVSNTPEPTRRIYDPVVKEKSSDGSCSKTKQIKYSRQPTYVCRSNDLKKKKDRLSLLVEATCEDIIKTEPCIDWSIYNTRINHNAKTSVCDFSYGESSSLATQNLPSLDTDEFQNLFSSESPLFQSHDDISTDDYNAFDVKGTLDKTKRKGERPLSFMDTNHDTDTLMTNESASTQKGRKRALSSTSATKSTKKLGSMQKTDKPKYIRNLPRATLPSLPVLETDEPYHTTSGDAVWYLGPEFNPKPEELVPPPQPTSTSVVEVPRWRIKHISPLGSSEDDSDVEMETDAMVEKRHLKYEIMERRQLKYHLRHLREQKLVEKLRQRQRDKWAGPGTSASSTPREFTILPQPHNDVQFIEICDTLPVSAFGENMRAMDNADFKLPWVLRTTSPRKRGKRSKTLNT